MDAETMAQQFLRHRRITQQLCDRMPDDRFSFAAFEGGMTFGALATHIAVAGDFYLASAEGVPFQRPDPGSLPQAPADIRAFLARKTGEQAERIRRLGDDLARTVTHRGQPIALGVLLGQMREHEAHHKGQMMMMLRMCGVRDELFYVQR